MSYRCKKKIWVNDHWANSMIMKDQVFKFIWASATLLNMYIVSIYTLSSRPWYSNFVLLSECLNDLMGCNQLLQETWTRFEFWECRKCIKIMIINSWMQSGQKAQPTCIFIGDNHSGPSIF